jgi:predicted Zn-dependent protease
VLAHELAHAIEHHPTRHLVRALGLSLVFDLLVGNGGTLRSAGEMVLALSYSRDLEREADDRALELLAGAGIPADGFARFFERLERIEGSGYGVPAWLRTHPPSAERAARSRVAPGAAARPALEPAAWEALKRICAAG